MGMGKRQVIHSPVAPNHGSAGPPTSREQAAAADGKQFRGDAVDSTLPTRYDYLDSCSV